MARSKKVEVELKFDARGAVTQIKGADGKFIALAGSAEKADSAIKRFGRNAKAALIGAGFAAIGAAALGFRELSRAVELAGIQQIAERKLEQALKNTGDTSEESAEKLKKLASEVQKISNFGDEAVITAQALLLSFKEVGGAEGAAVLTPRLADLQAGISGLTGESQDLTAVTQAVGRALTQGSGALSRYGISMSDAQKAQFNAATGMERVNMLAEILDSNFEGLAAASVHAGTQMDNAIGDLKESLGADLLPEIEDFQRSITQMVSDPRMIEFFRRVGESIVRMGTTLVETFQFGIPIAFHKFKAVFFDVAAGVIETAGKFVGALADPFEAAKKVFAGEELENAFAETTASLRETQESSKAAADEIFNLGLQASAARIQAKALAETNKELAASIREIGQAQGESGAASPVANVSAVDPRETQEKELTQITHDEAAQRMALQAQELDEADRQNKQKLLLIEKQKKAQRELTVLNELAATANVKNARDAANHLRGIVQSTIHAHVAEAVAAAIPKVPFPLNLALGPVAALATNALFNNLIPQFADGVTGFGGGLALVGERGPELVSLGQGSNVITNENTQRIIRRIDSIPSPGSPNVNVNNSGVENAIERLGDRIEQMQIQIDYFGLNDGLDRHNKQQRLIGNTS